MKIQFQGNTPPDRENEMSEQIISDANEAFAEAVADMFDDEIDETEAERLGTADQDTEDDEQDAATEDDEQDAATEAPKTAKPRTRAGSLQKCMCSQFVAVARGDGEDDNAQAADEERTTGCDKMTNRIFAQGHDAKLVSFLVRAEIDGLEIFHQPEGAAFRTSRHAVTAAGLVSDGLRDKARRALTKAIEKSIAREARETTRAARAQERVEAKAAREARRAEIAKASEEKRARNAEFVARQAGAANKTKVVEGSVTADPQPGDVPVSELDPANTDQWQRMAKKVRVGRWTYSGLPQEDGSLRYLNTAGQMKSAPAGKWSLA
jgi:hypothetical protein